MNHRATNAGSEHGDGSLSQRSVAVFALALAACVNSALAQSDLTLDPAQGWTAAAPSEPRPADAQLMDRARALLAEGNAKEARSILSDWLDENEFSTSPYLAEAYLLRGDARVATNSEWWALYDYEAVIKQFPGSVEFPKAVEREFDIGKRYLTGLKTKILWVRLEDATRLGEELLVRVQERLPGSRIAEDACLFLADHYYRVRDLTQAAEMYDIFLRNFPTSEHRQRAMQRRVYASIGQFKGPRYDSSGLVEARSLIKNFAAQYPAEADRAGMSDALAARLDESIAAQKLEKARWYFKQGDDVSARFTLNRLRRSHPRTVAATIAYDLLLERGWVKDQSAEPAKPTNPAAPESPSEPPKPDAPHADPAPDSKKEGAQ
ncbi:MAG: outer membrane protein assembly factor BamD [Phycisphaerae bacterium]|nr:outer membrane protein assembly factor BamD [Phycisphaerae bacterium]